MKFVLFILLISWTGNENTNIDFVASVILPRNYGIVEVVSIEVKRTPNSTVFSDCHERIVNFFNIVEVI